MKIPVYILAFLTLIACRSTDPINNIESSAINGSALGWQQINARDGSAPIARHEAAFIGMGDKFYLLGGRGEKQTSVYDTRTNSWTHMSTPPIEIHHFQPVIYKNDIYVLGAMTGGYPGETPIENILIYTPQTDSWKKGPQIPTDRNRGGAGAIIIGDDIYLVCGIKDGHRGDHKIWLDKFNIPSGKWTILADAPRPRDHFQAVHHNGKIYALGGRTTLSSHNPFKHTIGAVDVYNIESNEWLMAPNSLPTPRAGNMAIVIGDEIYVCGGESFSQEPAHSELEILDLKSMTWRSLAEIPQGRHGTGFIYFQESLFTASGSGNRGGGPELSDLYKFSM